MDYLPIVFIHFGDDEYIQYSLQQAKQSNPKSDVFLIGNEVNRKYCPKEVKFVLMEDYNKSALEVKSTWLNVSKQLVSNLPIFIFSSEYYLFCYQRWFILKDFLKKNSINECCYLDSDCMLYTDIGNPLYKTVQTNWTGIFTLTMLEEFCLHMLDVFTDKKLLLDAAEFTKKVSHPYVSDMVLLWLFNRFPENMDIIGYFPDCFFDMNILSDHMFKAVHADKFEVLQGRKKVYLLNRVPHCKNNENEYYRVNTLHFQGNPGKKFLKYFVLSDDVKSELLYFDYSECQWITV